MRWWIINILATKCTSLFNILISNKQKIARYATFVYDSLQLYLVSMSFILQYNKNFDFWISLVSHN